MKKRVAKNTRTIYHRGAYPGTFDPITFGHLDIMERSSGLVEELVVAVHKNIRKRRFFPLKKGWNWCARPPATFPTSR